MKTCTICGIAKPYPEFHRQASRKDGFASWCKLCKSIKKAKEYQANREEILIKRAQYRKDNPEKVSAVKKLCYQAKREQYLAKNKENYLQNQDSMKARVKAWREQNREKYLATSRQYYIDNREKRIANQSAYYLANREQRLEYHADYAKARRRTDPLYALSNVVRRRVSLALASQGYTKKSKTHEMLGCNYQYLRKHLESQFQDGMTWENRGEWHIDHIIPLASASSEAELLKLCHYTNLQPLWAFDNLSKGAKVLFELRAE